MAKRLVIVESPAKARTLEGFLGSQYAVKASVGHVRDLPKSRLGVDVEKDFAPKYTIPKEKKKVVDDLKKAAEKAGEVYLATDPDREGEAISWHLVQAMGLEQGTKSVRRVVFHEITKDAVTQAFAKPRLIDMSLVNAQQARRIIDRLVGYQISPLLWKKVRGRLSAGRVQSVAVRLLVEREREIQAFVPQEYWTIEAELAANGSRVKGQGSRGLDPGPRTLDPGPVSFRATLVGHWGKKEKLEIADEAGAQGLVADLKGASYAVGDVRVKGSQRQPSPPFTTSTLQQEAWRRLGFSAKRTMAVAQQLYEGLPLGSEGTVGLITYMRTDSTQVAASALEETRAFIKAKYGPSYLPSSARRFGKKAPGAQEAHEAIRPTSVKREPEVVKSFLTSDQNRLYGLVWRRMVASQMASAAVETTTVEVRASGCPSGAEYLLRASSSEVTFPGFLAVYERDKEDQEKDGKPLPALVKGEPLDLLGLLPDQHFTQPPPRYSEATLVKALEEKGIGRPSTYAPILSTIQEREYVRQVDKRLQPTELGFIVNDLLVEHFPDVVDVGFTAQMEGDLDRIAQGERQWVPLLREFYGPFSVTLEKASREMETVKPPEETTDEVCDLCGKPMVIKHGRFGRFLA
ncbi:MAG TPA: type I DNA topoisomerase, partial [Dehalococcoidia bacterium]|nr:type I DNA topoisomerase [Dehalococcoidia bacterium]